jgi:hypothetical protein
MTDTNNNYISSQQVDEIHSGVAEEELDLIDGISEVIFQGVILRVLKVLPEEKQEELGNLFEASAADSNNNTKREAIYTFLQKEVPQLDEFVQAETDAFNEAEGAILEEIQNEEAKQ